MLSRLTNYYNSVFNYTNPDSSCRKIEEKTEEKKVTTEQERITSYANHFNVSEDVARFVVVPWYTFPEILYEEKEDILKNVDRNKCVYKKIHENNGFVYKQIIFDTPVKNNDETIYGIQEQITKYRKIVPINKT